MFLSRNIKSLEYLSQQSQDDGKIEAKLVEISNSLLINYFIPTDSNFKSDLLPLIFQYVLPLTSDNLPVSVRVQAGSFLNRLCSLLTSFSPSCLLTVFDAPTLVGADGGGYSGYNSYGSSSNAPLTKKSFSVAAEIMMAALLLEPPAQAFFLIFLTKSLHFLPPKKREHFIGTCHDLLLNSKIEVLGTLTNDDWNILANSFSIEAISTIVTFLINNGKIQKSNETKDSIDTDEKNNTQQPPKNLAENITKAIVIFLERDPTTIMPLLLKTSSLNFLCQFIPLIPVHMHVPITLIKSRIISSLKNFKEDSNDASFALEIIKITMKRDRLLNEKNDWIDILSEVQNFWINPSTIISHKSSIIELFCIAAENKMIPVESLSRFFVIYNTKEKFDYELFLVKISNENENENDPIKSIPTTILVSLIQLTSVYIKMSNQIPKGFSDFCLKSLFDRDPLIYVAIIKLLTDCFNIMYKILPKISTKILDLCLNPLPKYFVEQIAVIHLIESIDFNDTFPIEKFRYKPIEIIYDFLKSPPHPSVLTEIKKMTEKMNLTLPVSRFDWFEQSSSLVYLLNSCSPFIIIELLDYQVIPPASFPVAVSFLTDCIQSYSNRNYNDKNTKKIGFNFQNDIQVIELSLLLFSRSLYIIVEAIKVMKIDIKYFSSLVKHHATNEWDGISSCLNGLYEVINENLNQTVFGKIISASFDALSSTIKYVNFLSIKKVIDIVKISTVFAAAFTKQTCKLVSEISRRAENAMNQKDQNNQQNFIQQFHQEIIKFFSSSFKYEFAVEVSLTAIECISESELSIVSDYIKVASNSNRIVLLMNKTATESHFLDKNNENEKEEESKKNDSSDEKNDSASNSFKSVFYNTFLAFKNDPDMRDYVAKCTKEIPYQSWSIEETDLSYFNKLQGIEVDNFDLLDSIHKKAINLYPNSFVIKNNKEGFDESLIIDELSDQIRFQINANIDLLNTEISYEKDINDNQEKNSFLNEIKPFSPYRGFEPNSALFFGFLWNSKRKLSDDDFMKAQEYAMFLNKSRITVSFLSYASRHGFKSKENSSSAAFVDVEKWMKLIEVDRFDQNTILSFCILTTFIRKSWNDLSTNELKFIYKSIDEIGFHDLSLFNIVRIFKEEGGFNRLLAESIISIDPLHFNEFPFFADIFLGKENFEKRFDEILNAIPSNIKKRAKRRILLSQENTAKVVQSDIVTKQQPNIPVDNVQKINESENVNIQLIHAKSGASVSSEKAVFNNFVYSDGKMKEYIEKEELLNQRDSILKEKEQNNNNNEQKEHENIDDEQNKDQNNDEKQHEQKEQDDNDDEKQNKEKEHENNDDEKQNSESINNDELEHKEKVNNDKQKEPINSDELEHKEKEQTDQENTPTEKDKSTSSVLNSKPENTPNNQEASSTQYDSTNKSYSTDYDDESSYTNDDQFNSDQYDQSTFSLNYEIATLFSRYLSPQTTLSKHEQFILPRGVPLIDSNYYPASIELERFKIIKYRDEFEGNTITTDKLISVFESSSLCDSFIFFVLLHLGMTDEEYQRCLGPLQRFTKSHSLNVHLVMADLSYLSTFEKTTKIVNIPQKAIEITFSDDKYIRLSRYPTLLLTPSASYTNCINNPNFVIDGNKPPSYTREFVSLLTSPYLPINISMPDLITLTKSPNLRPVLFPLLYKGFEKFSLGLFDLTTPLFSIPDEDYLILTNDQSIKFGSELSSSFSSSSSSSSSSSFSANNNSELDTFSSFSIILTTDTLNKLKSYFSKVTKTTSKIAKEFFKMNPESLCKCFNTVSADAAFIEISEKLIDTVINNPSYLTIAVDIMKAIIGHTELMQLCMIANSESFLNANQFICVFLMLKFFEKKLEKSNDAVFKEIWKEMKQSIPEKVRDKKRLQILTMNDAVLAFADIFNSSI